MARLTRDQPLKTFAPKNQLGKSRVVIAENQRQNVRHLPPVVIPLAKPTGRGEPFEPSDFEPTLSSATTIRHLTIYGRNVDDLCRPCRASRAPHPYRHRRHCVNSCGPRPFLRILAKSAILPRCIVP